MFRCYDTHEKRWVRNFYVMANGDMFMFERSLVRKRAKQMSESRYVLHREIGLSDRNGTKIYEGDIVKNVDDDDIVGVVAYVPEQTAYYIFNDKTTMCYSLLLKICSRIEVVGNVFDNPEMINGNDNCEV